MYGRPAESSSPSMSLTADMLLIISDLNVVDPSCVTDCNEVKALHVATQ